MIPTRILPRSTFPQAVRTARISHASHARFQSSSSSSFKNAKGGAGQHFAAGIAGGLAAAAILCGAYLLTPAGKMHRKISKGVSNAASKKYCYSYVWWLPGGRQFVDTVFQDAETLRQNHQKEFDKIISDAYVQFQDLPKSDLSFFDTASKAYEILTDLSKKLGNLGGDAFKNTLNNHPQIKQKFGGSVDRLRQMGEDYGPAAKQQVDQAWKQAKEIMGSGASAENLEKVRQLRQEKVDQRGVEQAKPYLEKNSNVKELIEKNENILKQGNTTELFDRAKSAAETGDLSGLEDYINQAYLNMIPNGSEVLETVNQLREVARNHNDKGEELFKEMMELEQVLEKKSGGAREIIEKGKKVVEMAL
ncbi:hypothetical protein F4779DRAFT_632103 [Xylariaceae sp. FL0662B]|nr:hypothetical protein F4779DRAFT_632103 [Xylariaceae sp. FL0662B]